MTKTDTTTIPGNVDAADIQAAVRRFAEAAEALCRIWQTHSHNPDGTPTWVDDVLTTTFPAAITMSFDEYVCELWGWEADLADGIAARDNEKTGTHVHHLATNGDECLLCGALICPDCGRTVTYEDDTYRHVDGSSCWLHPTTED